VGIVAPIKDKDRNIATLKTKVLKVIRLEKYTNYLIMIL